MQLRPKPSPRHFLEELAEQTEAASLELGRPLWLIAESDLNDPRLLRSRDVGGYGLHAQWSDDFHALHVALTGESSGYYADFTGLRDLATTLMRGWVYEGRYSRYRRRRHGAQLANLGGQRLLGYAQNHDQIGNRARGERLAHLVGPELARIAAALVLTAPFIPMLFMGEEWAASSPFQYFIDHHDPDLREAVRVGRCTEFASFGWSPDAVPNPCDIHTFECSCLRWDEINQEPHREMLNWHRALLRLRQRLAELKAGRMESVHATAAVEERTLVMQRGRATVAVNLAREERTVAADGDVVLASRSGVGAEAGEALLPPVTVAILLR